MASSNTISPNSDDDDNHIKLLEDQILRLEARVAALEALEQRRSTTLLQEEDLQPYIGGSSLGGSEDYDDNDEEDDMSSLGESDIQLTMRSINICGAVAGDMAMARADCYSDESSDDDDDDDGKKLLSMAKRGRHQSVTELLESKPGLIRTKSADGETVLHVAAANGHADTVKHLVRFLKSKRNDNKQHGRGLLRAKTLNGDTVLHVAARRGRIDILEHLLGVMSKKEDDHEAESKSSETARALMETNKDGDTAVHVALKLPIPWVALYMMTKEPDVAYEVNSEGMSPLFLAVKGNHDNMVEDLFKVMPGKDVDESRKEKIMRPEAPLLHQTIRARNLGMLTVLLDNIPSLITSKDKRGWAPLSYAAYKGYDEEVTYFLEVFPKCEEECDDDGSFPIHKAARGGNVSVLKEFLSRCPNTIYQTTKDHQNIIHVAHRHGKRKTVTYLKKRHAQDLKKILGNKSIEDVLQEVKG